MDRSPKQLQELTLALLYLTSLQDHDDPAGHAGAGRSMTFRFWRT